MILDRGICRVYHKTNNATAGSKPVWKETLFHTSYYGELSFETAPSHPTEYREEINTATRVRILQNRGINNHDLVTLEPFGAESAPAVTQKFEVTRAWHGHDDDSGEEITDLTLEVVNP